MYFGPRVLAAFRCPQAPFLPPCSQPSRPNIDVKFPVSPPDPLGDVCVWEQVKSFLGTFWSRRAFLRLTVRFQL